MLVFMSLAHYNLAQPFFPFIMASHTFTGWDYTL
ncbi:hypothetical protein YPC_3516 [Yersinia pestis biovar Medievalis str. Harbin 35]|nr:hypothetical protein YPC_3516 [Yersinia pestis biovar Medievalis str. Harbin 35]EEO77279.1 hypothetical protein YP516_0938 [Yersinia pestis Nepal516]EEO79876.1 hypothetical protein YPF_3876 [Yersinia pestis biovar Orientalis str. India 195]EEO85245.1 hypothetical protein YPH_1090 [Yersinia pestis biovar Orientalis str. PEXU2]EEO88968.1 hypothetical protein YPS_3825 [Yersinia pestis Pestoides A]